MRSGADASDGPLLYISGDCGKSIFAHADTHRHGAIYLPETFARTATLGALLS
jgi:hypothetical protein